MNEEWPSARLKSTLERVANARDDLVGRRVVTRFSSRKRGLRVAMMLLAMTVAIHSFKPRLA